MHMYGHEPFVSSSSVAGPAALVLTTMAAEGCARRHVSASRTSWCRMPRRSLRCRAGAPRCEMLAIVVFILLMACPTCWLGVLVSCLVASILLAVAAVLVVMCRVSDVASLSATHHGRGLARNVGLAIFIVA